MINLFLHAALLTTTPILLAAIGGFVNRIGGLVNLGLESMMLAGALVAVEVSAATGSALLATLAAAAVGAIVGLLMSLVITRLRANEIIVGLGFTVAVAGLVRFILKSAYGASGTYSPPGVAMLPRLDIPLLKSIPVLGALSATRSFDLARLGARSRGRLRALLALAGDCRLRATGPAEATVRSVGLAPLDDPRRLDGFRRRAVRPRRRASVDRRSSASSTRESPAGGASSRWRPSISAATSAARTALGALLFGVFDAAQIRLQGRGVPAELVQTLPYVIVIVVLTGLGVADRRASREGSF